MQGALKVQATGYQDLVIVVGIAEKSGGMGETGRRESFRSRPALLRIQRVEEFIRFGKCIERDLFPQDIKAFRQPGQPADHQDLALPVRLGAQQRHRMESARFVQRVLQPSKFLAAHGIEFTAGFWIKDRLIVITNLDDGLIPAPDHQDARTTPGQVHQGSGVSKPQFPEGIAELPDPVRRVRTDSFRAGTTPRGQCRRQ